MKLFDVLINGFIDTFGITRPNAEEKRSAGRAIVLMIVGTAVFVALIFGLVLYIISR